MYEEIQENFPEEFALRDQDKYRYRYPKGEVRAGSLIGSLQCVKYSSIHYSRRGAEPLECPDY